MLLASVSYMEATLYRLILLLRTFVSLTMRTQWDILLSTTGIALMTSPLKEFGGNMMGHCCHGLHGGAVKQMNQTEEKARTVERSLFRGVHMLGCGTVIS